MAGYYALQIFQGETFERSITYMVDDVPVDLTGWSARLQIRATAGDTKALVSLSSPDDGITLGGVAGTIVVRVDAASTAAFAWRSGIYDLELEQPGGDVVKLLLGPVNVVPEVTR